MKYLIFLLIFVTLLSACTVSTTGDAKKVLTSSQDSGLVPTNGTNETNSSQPTCYDSDGGINMYKFGTVSGLGGSGLVPYELKDSCLNNREVREWYCNADNAPRNTFKLCGFNGGPNEQRNYCREGQCVAIPNTCNDTDGGNYPDVFGSVEGNWAGSYYNYNDTCTNQTGLREWVCDNDGTIYGQGTRYAEYVTCLGGCDDGACKEYTDIEVEFISVGLLYGSQDAVQSTFRISNLGNRDVDVRAISQAFSPLGLVSNTTSTYSLNAGENIYFTENMTISARGNYRFVLEAYADQYEADYTNNQAEGIYNYNPLVNEPKIPRIAME